MNKLISGLTFGAAVVVLASMGLANPASAAATTLCPTSGTVGGFGFTTSNVAGPLDGTCGANSAVKIDVAQSTDYGKLTFDASSTGYPAGLTLGSLQTLSANVAFTGLDDPFYILAFTDLSNSLGQGSATDQILFIEFQPSTLTGNMLNAFSNSTLFNVFDNTTGVYLQGPNGQQNTKTLDMLMAQYPSLASTSLDEIRIAEGLSAGDVGALSLTVNSLTVSTASVPEPISLAVFGVGLAGAAALRRRKSKKAAA